MARSIAVIGVDPAELRWLRMLLALLRHPDPGVPELARQALVYLTDAALDKSVPRDKPLDHAG